MKRILFSILTFVLLYSCSTNSGQEKINTAISVDFKKLDTTISFNGNWLSEDYFNNIIKYKSPKKAQDSSKFIIIPDSTLKPTFMIYNFHEGGAALTILKHSEKYEIWEVQGDSITQQSGDIQILSPTKMKIGTENFVKINSISDQGNFMILEEILFKGIYSNSEGNKKIEFKNNGELSGLADYHFYSPDIDYFDAGMQVDQIRLSKIKNDYENCDTFGFKFNKDTLELYKLNILNYDSINKMPVEVEYGQLFYKLNKKE